MPDDVEENGAEVSDAMSENDNECDDSDLPIRDEDDKMGDQNASSDNGVETRGEGKQKYDPKDPLRPRRKKARRACFACQRAHLTCGDERPCQRCIKRGLAEACQDGVRKKAKYLHDAPPEALRPVLGPNYNASLTSPRSNDQQQVAGSVREKIAPPGAAMFAQSSNPSFALYSGPQTPAVAVPEGIPFPSQPSPVSPSFQTPTGTPRPGQLGPMTLPGIPTNTVSFFDPSNPGMFNFDLDGLNFGSQYPALEFGMLGHMSSGAVETPRDPSMTGPPSADVGFAAVFGGGSGQFDSVYNSGMMRDFTGMDPSANGIYLQGNLQHGLPHAYAISAGPTGLASPSTENTASPRPPSISFDASPAAGDYAALGGPKPVQAPSRPNKSTPAKGGPQSILGKRQRDPSWIYETVKEPYPYLNGFHNLIAFLQRRFPAHQTLKIAKSLASIRPSFISCTKTLNRQDLVFMEKCFQRTLFEYEDFMQHCSAPTIVCRRTGEVAAVNKEFTALTGWTKDVLLGKEPNENVNTGGSASTSGGNTGRAGISTPRLKSISVDTAKAGEGRPQPVFIPELLDDDSVVQFYEDFAHLAFGDSRGHVNRTCRLLKYRSRSSLDAAAPEPIFSKDARKGILSNRVIKIDSEHGTSKIEKDGKVDCTYCWVIKRDVFDIPMLIVMNFLPCYYRNQEPHQLAV